MNTEERQVISDIFQRLKQAASQPRDPEAERFIAERLREQPYAPYAMAQLVYVQEEAIKSLNQQLEELQAEVERARSQGGAGGGGFLSSIFGGGARQEEPPRRTPWGGQAGQPGGQQGYAQQQGYAPQQQGGPWAGQQGGGFGGQAGGGGFLRSALGTAAGVAGGMMIANALGNAFRGGHQTLGGFTDQDFAGGAAGASTAGLGGVTDAMYGGGAGADQAGLTDADFGAPDQGVGDGAITDADFGGDFGNDSGGDSDWT
jgi:hypothetical protein